MKLDWNGMKNIGYWNKAEGLVKIDDFSINRKKYLNKKQNANRTLIITTLIVSMDSYIKRTYLIVKFQIIGCPIRNVEK
jgi:hypothetical protein